MIRCASLKIKQCLLDISTKKIFLEQNRTTYILRRIFPVRLDGLQKPAKERRTSDFVYEEVDNLALHPLPDIECILTRTVEGLGVRGDLVTVKRVLFREHLYLAGIAVYASPENIAEFEKEIKKGLTETTYIEKSAFVQKTIRHLKNSIINVILNKEQEWTLQNWHIKVALRKANIMCSDSNIKLPDRPITHDVLPDLNGKEFSIIISINNRHQIPVRCRITLFSPKNIAFVHEDSSSIPWGGNLLFPDLEDVKIFETKQDENFLDYLSLQALLPTEEETVAK